MTTRPWRVVLGSEAEKDFVSILTYTRDLFGPRQAALYETTILDALAALGESPDVVGSLARDDLRPGLRTLHVARHARRGRHVVFYRVATSELIQVIRIPHDAMDFARHVPPDVDGPR